MNELKKPTSQAEENARTGTKESARERKETTQTEPPKFLFLKTWGIVFLIISILYLMAR